MGYNSVLLVLALQKKPEHFSSYGVVIADADFLWWQDLNELRDDLMELKPTFFAGVPRVFDRIHEGTWKCSPSDAISVLLFDS